MKFKRHNGGPPLSFTKRVIAWTIRGHQRELLVDPEIFENRYELGWFTAWEVDDNTFIRVNAELVECDELDDDKFNEDELDILKDFF